MLVSRRIDLSSGNFSREREGSAAVCQRGRLPAPGAVDVRRWAWRHAAVHTIDRRHTTRSPRSPPDGPSHRRVTVPRVTLREALGLPGSAVADGPSHSSVVRSARRHCGGRRKDGTLCRYRFRSRNEHHLHQNHRQLYVFFFFRRLSSALISKSLCLLLGSLRIRNR